MNVNERTGRKAGRDLAGIGVGTLAAASLGEYVTLGTYTSLLVAAVANVVLLAGYRWLRDRGVLMPEDDGAFDLTPERAAALKERVMERVRDEPTIGGNV